MSEDVYCPNCGSVLWSTLDWSSEPISSYWLCVRCGKKYDKETMKELKR